MRIRAFNLVPGLVVSINPSLDFYGVVVTITRDHDKEEVTMTLRPLDTSVADYRFYTVTDFNREVDIQGVVVNPQDPDDTDTGSEVGLPARSDIEVLSGLLGN